MGNVALFAPCNSMTGLGDRLDAAIARHEADPEVSEREYRACANELFGWYRRQFAEGNEHLVDPKMLRLDRAYCRAVRIELMPDDLRGLSHHG
jgi:hypothetical protein